ncbi:MAG: hypothetical protein A2Z07_02980 [Armatimonadetes bacterium RBG_16_67_12]|nr:MAG: hypothetical protein A2Z07_02980 [Armatimonadetes bacterium RBG_16_67_12]
MPECADQVWEMIAPYPFDYLIGSVHFVGTGAGGVPSAYDLSGRGFERGVKELFGGDIRQMVGEYYSRVRALVAWGRVAILGHLDRIKLWNRGNRHFDEDEPWYCNEVEAALRACAHAGIIVELNTSGWRHAVRVKRCCARPAVPALRCCVMVDGASSPTDPDPTDPPGASKTRARSGTRRPGIASNEMKRHGAVEVRRCLGCTERG